jgi:hypothetical protein
MLGQEAITGVFLSVTSVQKSITVLFAQKKSQLETMRLDQRHNFSILLF